MTPDDLIQSFYSNLCQKDEADVDDTLLNCAASYTSLLFFHLELCVMCGTTDMTLLYISSFNTPIMSSGKLTGSASFCGSLKNLTSHKLHFYVS